MNPTSSNDALTQRLERLVDGELSAAEYRELLTTLDSTPEGWRRCSLAFLEAQALRQACRGILHEPMPAMPTAPATLVTPASAKSNDAYSNPKHAIPWRQFLSLAASLVLAFMLGRGSLTTTSTPTNTAPTVAQSEPLINHSPTIPETDSRSPAGRLSLLVNGDGYEPRAREIPVYEATQIDPEMLQPLDEFSSEMEETFRRAGMRVHRQQQFVPLPLDEHREMLVPMQRVRVEPKDLPVY
jgi:hypothetical protein